MQPAPGAVLDGRYTLLSPLGEGTFGSVWRAQDQRFPSRPVAVKLLKAEHQEQPETVARFLREADALAAVQHPRVIAVLDRGTHEGWRYLVTEYVQGLSLATWIAQHRSSGRRPDLGVVRSLVDQLCDGVAAAHALRIPGPVVHRDLKPANVMLTPDGADGYHVKVLDFGVARVGDRSITLTGSALGTLAYMPPEQSAGRPDEVSPRSDVFSLAVVCFELLTLDPFAGPELPWWLGALQGVDGAEALRVRRPEVPEAVRALVGRALRPVPHERPEDAAALRNAWRRAWEGASTRPESLPVTMAWSPPAELLASVGRSETQTPSWSGTQTPRGRERHAPTIPLAPSVPEGVARSGPFPATIPGAPAGATARSRRWVLAALAGLAVVFVAMVAVIAAASGERALLPETDCGESLSARWRVRRGTFVRGARCGEYEAASTAGEDVSLGYVELRDEVAPRLRFSARTRRLTEDRHRPQELYFRGGAFGASEQGEWYLYESEDHWTGWRPSAALHPGDNLLRVEQRGRAVRAWINDESVGEFTLREEPEAGPVALFFKGDPAGARVLFWDLRLEELP